MHPLLFLTGKVLITAGLLISESKNSGPWPPLVIGEDSVCSVTFSQANLSAGIYVGSILEVASQVVAYPTCW